MAFIKNILDNMKPTFSEGGKLSAFGSLFDAMETFFFVPNETAKVRGAQIHDAIDSKRSIFFVIIAMIPAILFGMWNIGYQHYAIIGESDTSLMGNFLDGLDGLSCGISSIVICVIGFIAYLTRRIDLAVISLVLLGSILGILPYNFYPAKIFVGDCGALFMGFMIACLSILGFKASTFITLGFPGGRKIAVIAEKLHLLRD